MCAHFLYAVVAHERRTGRLMGRESHEQDALVGVLF